MPDSAQDPLVIVYQATNRINGKRYIGVTKLGLRSRMRRHQSEARKSNGLFQRALRKYGMEGFAFEVLYDFQDDYDLARAYEWEMIAKHRPEYNLTAGGEGGTPHELTRAKMSARQKGRKRSEEAKANMSAAQRRRAIEHPRTPETREKMRQARLGKRHRPESIAKMVGREDSDATRAKKSAAQTGRPPTKGRTGQAVPEETKAKISQTLKQRGWQDTPARVASRARTGASAASEARKIAVECVNDGRVFESLKAAAEFYGLVPTKLSLAFRKGWRIRGMRFIRRRAADSMPSGQPDGTYYLAGNILSTASEPKADRVKWW